VKLLAALLACLFSGPCTRVLLLIALCVLVKWLRIGLSNCWVLKVRQIAAVPQLEPVLVWFLLGFVWVVQGVCVVGI
jgi:hypothetical protein